MKFSGLFIGLGLVVSASAQTYTEYKTKGELAMHDGDNVTALRNFQKAIELDSTKEGNALIYSYAGLCAKNLNLPDETRKYMQASVDRGIMEPIVYSILVDVCRDQKDLTCQENTLKKAITIFPLNAIEYQKKLAYVYNNSKNYMALEKLGKEITKADSTDEKMLELYGVALQKQNKSAEAIKTFENLLSISPDNFNANMIVGGYYYQTGSAKIDKEKASYDKLKNPDRVIWSKFNKSTIAIINDYYPKAAKYLEKAYEQKADENVKKMLFAIYTKMNEREKAKKYE